MSKLLKSADDFIRLKPDVTWTPQDFNKKKWKNAFKKVVTISQLRTISVGSRVNMIDDEVESLMISKVISRFKLDAIELTSRKEILTNLMPFFFICLGSARQRHLRPIPSSLPDSK